MNAKLSPAMVAMLRSARDRGDPFAHIYGQPQSVHGGASGTVAALVRRGLLDKAWNITPAGRNALLLRQAGARRP